MMVRDRDYSHRSQILTAALLLVLSQDFSSLDGEPEAVLVIS